MTALPAALAPWRSQLDLFDPEVQVSLGALVGRLALALGPLRVEQGDATGEPNGYDGLALRGSYERLLPSEWLLAEELPDEFLRRAAAGEHLFSRLAFRQPAGTRRSVALLDAGPDQLGAPRVAQIAALIALAARAERAGAGFSWGLVQDSTRFDEVTPATIGRLLATRPIRDASEADLLGWRERAGATARDDWWWVGGRYLASLTLAQEASILRIEDVLSPSERTLRATAIARARSPRVAELPLPPPPICARLLRDPFGARPSPRSPPLRRTAGIPTSNLRFSTRGTHLMGRLADGSLWGQPLPNSQFATIGHPMIVPLDPNERLIAAGFEPHRGLVLSVRGGALTLRRTGRRGGPSGNPIALGDAASWSGWADVRGQLQPLFRHWIGSGPLRVEETFALAADGRLLVVRGDISVNEVARGVVEVAPFFGRLAWVAEATGQRLRRLEIHDGFVERAFPVDLGSGERAPLEAFFGYGGGFNDPALGGIGAVRVGQVAWRLICGGPSAGALLEPEGTVAGVTRDGSHGGEPALLVISPDYRSLRLVGVGFERPVTAFSSKVDAVTCSHANPHVAWRTGDGDLVVWALDANAALMRLRAERAP